MLTALQMEDRADLMRASREEATADHMSELSHKGYK